MMGDEKEIAIPKVFISYSWSSEEHISWVIEFATRLSSDGVDVILDRWELKEGHDIYDFMEKMVKDKDVKKVLVICDKIYKEKAEDRKGGVGTESQIISPKVYKDVGQEKFIPIIKERDENGPCVPTFFEARKYIDFTNEDLFEDSYEQLLRNLYDKPMLKKPPLGSPPPFVFENAEQITYKTTYHKKKLKNALLNGKERIVSGLLTDFLDEFINMLEEFRIKDDDNTPFDDKVIESIEKMLPLRDDFVEVVFDIFKYYPNVDLEIFKDFLERLLTFSFNHPSDSKGYRDIDLDNYRFFSYEIFIYFISALIKKSRYKEASFFIQSIYFVNIREGLRYYGASKFDIYVRSLDDIRNRKLSLRKISLTAHILMSRINIKAITKQEIIDTDFLLFYISQLFVEKIGLWWPRCFPYKRFSPKFDIFEMMISKSHFDKIKILFQVSNKDELVTLVAKRINENIKGQGNRNPYYKMDMEIPSIDEVFDFDKIALFD